MDLKHILEEALKDMLEGKDNPHAQPGSQEGFDQTEQKDFTNTALVASKIDKPELPNGEVIENAPQTQLPSGPGFENDGLPHGPEGVTTFALEQTSNANAIVQTYAYLGAPNSIIPEGSAILPMPSKSGTTVSVIKSTPQASLVHSDPLIINPATNWIDKQETPMKNILEQALLSLDQQEGLSHQTGNENTGLETVNASVPQTREIEVVGLLPEGYEIEQDADEVEVLTDQQVQIADQVNGLFGTIAVVEELYESLTETVQDSPSSLTPSVIETIVINANYLNNQLNPQADPLEVSEITETTNQPNVEVVLESLKDTASRAWQAVKDAIKRAIEWIRSFLKRIVSSVARAKQRVAIAGKRLASGRPSKKKITSKDGFTKVLADGNGNLPSAAELTKELEGVGKTLLEVSEASAQAIKQSTDAISASQKSPEGFAALADKLKDIVQEAKDKQAKAIPSGGKKLVGKTVIRRTKRGVSGKGLDSIKAVLDEGGRELRDEVDPPNVPQAKAVLSASEGLINDLEKFVDAQEKTAKELGDLVSSLDKLDGYSGSIASTLSGLTEPIPASVVGATLRAAGAATAYAESSVEDNS